MHITKALSIFAGIVLITALVMNLSLVSAYSPTFELSDRITFKEDISGSNRGFFIKRSVDVPRETIQGYYDWSYRPSPRNVVYPHPESYRVSDRLALEAFRTFQSDSKDKNRLRLEKERNRRSYYLSYYPRRYNSYYYGF